MLLRVLNNEQWQFILFPGPEDRLITVSFTNGKVEKVQANTAVWIPKEVFERLALELKMPREARVALSTEENYPQQSMEGLFINS